ncbi:SDR family oxidoreductase [Tenacibaculum sp. AHE15PA]|uniref:SDR family oxidoreductase n=1 Tax=unclassified Tenacibaculum TaxID=2635139 RepID=UPI001C4E7974|nr:MULTISPECIES: SDR family oxidoreductase [unclassified Tenacibaculum]QXP74373.1 SDR family oxidoreductase [Tenacibaculum sp. AHE14PA]QXP75258.1 SDR family oxidoreductase [Tenacibaculum sp. AHE15PA]
MSKVILITGASSGIGKAIATYLHAKNYTVYGTSRNPAKVKVPFNMVVLDVTDAKTIDSAVSTVIEKEGKIDVLINNAGKGITGSIEDTPTDEMRANFNTNFFGVIDVAKAVLPQMRKQKSGTIINVTSIAGYMGLPFRGIYSASKGALELVTEALSMEVKSFGIKVINVAPGDFATNIASGRFHTPVYENSAYKEAYTENLALMDGHVNSGMDPKVMAKAIHQIIEKKNPNIHYKIGGFMEKFSVVLKRVLPDKVYEKLLMNHYKL